MNVPDKLVALIIIFFFCTFAFFIYHMEMRIDNSELLNSYSKAGKYDLAHLKQTTQKVFGPVQDDEALFLFGFIKLIRPKVMLECGMLNGYSTENFLKSLDSDAQIYTYDIVLRNKESPAFLDKRFKFMLKSQVDFSPSDINNKKIDFVYLDSAHDFSLYKKVFVALNIKAETEPLSI